MNINRLFLPLSNPEILKLKAGEIYYLNGIVYTARDQAHQKLFYYIKSKNRLPFKIKTNCIYYCGPTPKRQNQVIGSCGPTTSSRMDSYTPILLEKGFKIFIGKGKRSEEVLSSIVKNKGVYFTTIGGAGAFLSTKVKKCKVIFYKELASEAIHELELKDFPAVVSIDSKGRSIFN